MLFGTEPLLGLIEFDLWHGMHLLCQRNTIPQRFGKVYRNSESFSRERWDFSEFRLYAVVNERGGSVIAFHLLPHSETVLQGRENEIYRMFIILFHCLAVHHICNKELAGDN